MDHAASQSQSSIAVQPFPSPPRDPRKLPKLISGSGSGTETKYRQETLTEEEEEETAPVNNEEVAPAKQEEENEDEADADDEAELTDVRKDKDQSEIKLQETTEEEVKEDLVSTKGSVINQSEIETTNQG